MNLSKKLIAQHDKIAQMRESVEVEIDGEMFKIGIASSFGYREKMKLMNFLTQLEEEEVEKVDETILGFLSLLITFTDLEVEESLEDGAKMVYMLFDLGVFEEILAKIPEELVKEATIFTQETIGLLEKLPNIEVEEEIEKRAKVETKTSETIEKKENKYKRIG